jgi:hypothetical protein
MTEVPTITLQELMLQEQPLGTAVVIDGQEAVILARGEDGELVDVCQSGEIRPYGPDTRATMLADPDRKVAALLDAYLLVDSLRRQAAQQQAQQAAECHDVLTRIRDYAIGKYEDGVFCREGLDDVLSTFGLPEYGSDGD